MKVVSATRSLVGESPFWSVSDQTLYWSDLRGQAIRACAPSTGRETATEFTEPVAAPIPTHGHGVAALLASGLFLRGRDGSWRLHSRPQDLPPSHRFNDATIDPVGRLVAGTMLERGRGEGPPGRLYLLDRGEWRRIADGFLTINGLAFSPCGRSLYLSDSHASVSRVWIADYDVATGSLGERRTFATLVPQDGRPDGAAVDIDGCYWVAGVGGGRLLRFSPDGTLERSVETPVRFPTKIAFGGADLTTAYVTSMLAPEPAARTPEDGALLSFSVPVPGCPIPPLCLP